MARIYLTQRSRVFSGDGKLCVKGVVFGSITLCLLVGTIQAKYSGGTGTADDPYLIATPADMNAIGADSNDWDKHFLMTADINLAEFTGMQFNIIGPNYDNSFKGVFDGDGHSIYNFTYDSNGIGYVGLFGDINDPNAEIKDLGLIEPNIDGGSGNYIGSLVGYLEAGVVNNCDVKGGIVSGKGNIYIGGLVGSNRGSISNCWVNACVSGEGNIGGLVGFQGRQGKISDCYSVSEVSGNAGFIGGLIGYNWGVVSNCFTAGTVAGGGGGLVGRNMGPISNCYSTAEVFGSGGLVGWNYNKISNCYSTGDVFAADGTAGGLIGVNGDLAIVSHCYSTGKVIGFFNVGGLVGSGAGATYTKCFWDKTVNPTIPGIGDESDPDVIGESTVNMQEQSTFIDAGWDFMGETTNGPNDIWWLDTDGFSYPKLSWVLYDGNGTEQDPYLIHTAVQMNVVGIRPSDWDAHFTLADDIDLIGLPATEFNRIGYYNNPGDNLPFTGIFDGKGHKISNFNWSSEDTDYVGLFGYLGSGGEVKNLGLEDVDIDAGSGWGVGALVGRIYLGTIRDCYAKGNIEGDFRVGALVGGNYEGLISNCYSTGSVDAGLDAGGLVANNFGTVSGCYSTVLVSGYYDTGGLTGNNYGTIEHCYAGGLVIGDDCVGGLVGNNFGTVNLSYSRGLVSGYGYTGGLVGYDDLGDYVSSFWDNTVNSGLTGIGNASDPNVTGKSTANMKKQNTFTVAGWDFGGESINGTDDIWRMCVDDVNYPKLLWEFPEGDFVCPDGVNLVDFSVLADAWLSEPVDLNWNLVCDISEPNDSIINELDLKVFREQWLTGF